MANSSEEKVKYTKKELIKKLTDKEKAFCHYYIRDWNGSEAARKAGYSPKTATEIAHQNLLKLHIKQYIDYIKDDIAKEVGISKMMLIDELKSIATSSIAHLHNTWITRKEFEDLSESEKSSIQEISTSVRQIRVEDEKQPIEVEYVKIKLYDKLKAVESIFKAMGWNEPEKVEQTNLNYNTEITKEEAKTLKSDLENEY